MAHHAKKIHPLIAGFNRLDFLLMNHPTPIYAYTDHKNIVNVLRPEWTPNKAHASRLLRWTMCFQQADLVVEHIPGELNHLPDILTRWANPNDKENLLKPVRELPAARELAKKVENYSVRWPKRQGQGQIAWNQPVPKIAKRT